MFDLTKASKELTNTALYHRKLIKSFNSIIVSETISKTIIQKLKK